MDKTALLLSDPNRLFREGLRSILSSKKIEITGEVPSLAEAIEDFPFEDRIDAVLCDPSSDPKLEFAAIAEIKRRFPAVTVLVLTEQPNAQLLDMAVAAGASGFLPKDISANALRLAIELVLLDEPIFPTLGPLLKKRSVFGELKPNAPQGLDAARPRVSLLSSRENEVLGFLVDGLPNKTIALNLGMAEATVKVHIKALMRKLNVQNRTQAAIWAMHNVPH